MILFNYIGVNLGISVGLLWVYAGLAGIGIRLSVIHTDPSRHISLQLQKR